ncbi:MAG: ABC transporter permease subunit [Gammaproteobacteria bacterium]|nr:ABC transporter permease subunit [Gammaproteobacteria bacterium]
MTSDNVRKAFTVFFVLGFFIYLFGPLIIMGFTSFNSSSFPKITPWECFTVEWFDVLTKDDKLLEGLRNSIFIGIGVVVLAVPLGLAGALMLTQVKERVRPWYYTIVISPILVPGVVLGISTLLFWDRIGGMFGASRNSIFYDGFFLTIIGQATFISAYTMLVFISRLQRFDRDQEDAALDLGATHVQTFRKILLPFLKPAIASACVLAFLASFENYNTTVFTIVSESTLTTFLAAKVRHGINPSISALAVIIVVITVFGAALHEVLKRRELAAEKIAMLVASGKVSRRKKPRKFILEPAVLMIFAVLASGVGTAYFAGTIGVEQCKVDVLAEKKRATALKILELQEKTKNKQAAIQAESTETTVDKSNRAGTANFNSIFSTGNLQGQTGTSDSEARNEKTDRAGTENFNSIFSTDNLQDQSGTKESQPEQEDADRAGTENFNSIFSASNLQNQTGTAELKEVD